MNNIVLVIDDEEDILSYIKRLLTLNGYKVYCAGYAKEAIKMFKDKSININLVIADFSLPGKSGVELIEELKLIKPGFKVIITSGYLDNDPVMKPVKEKGYKFIQKPFEIKELLKAVRETLKAVSCDPATAEQGSE